MVSIIFTILVFRKWDQNMGSNKNYANKKFKQKKTEKALPLGLSKPTEIQLSKFNLRLIVDYGRC